MQPQSLIYSRLPGQILTEEKSILFYESAPRIYIFCLIDIPPMFSL